MSIRARMLALTAAFVVVATPLAAQAATPGPSPSVSSTVDPTAPRTTTVTSFDGTSILVRMFAVTGRRAPTILYGPGWGSPGASDPNDATIALLRAHGYNVVTWDPRGRGGSGGAVAVDYYKFEGRDMRALLNWLARQPEAQLDRPGDPRVGMTGSSYGGGIQLVTAAIDHRVDAITPTIAWNSLVDSLYPNRTVKQGWGNILCALGGNRVDPVVSASCARSATGQLPTDAQNAWWADHGPRGRLINNITAPTLIVQGTVDTLFPLREGIANYQALRARRVPVKMIWFCGGHGVCTTPAGTAGHVESQVVAWFDRYVKRQRSTSTGPGFEYVDESGAWHGAPVYPLARTGRTTSSGAGTLTFGPQDASGTTIAAQPATNALRVPLTAPSAARQIVGPPTLTLRYQGTATPGRTSLFAQVVDEARGLVAGNFATAVPVVLDGRPHTVTLPLGALAWTFGPGSRLALQLTGGSRLYAPQTSTGSLTARVSVTLPVAMPAQRVPNT